MLNLVRSDRESRWGNWGQVERIFLRFDIAGGGELRLCGEAARKPQEFVEALKKRGFKVNVMSNAQLEARRQADLEMAGWQGKHNKKQPADILKWK